MTDTKEQPEERIIWKIKKMMEGDSVKRDWEHLCEHQKLYGYSDEDVMWLWGRICRRKAESIGKLLQRFGKTRVSI